MVNEALKQIIDKSNENRLSHAFLLETNDFAKCLNELYFVIKNILCHKKFDDNCEEECTICHLIDKNALPSVIYIEPDGASIKKEQILELKDKILSKPIYTEYNVYIINNAEKLTLSSANTMLKFLEEPSGQVIGFFITDNKENIISTIRSRCQLISVLYDQDELYEELHINEIDFDRYESVLSDYLQLLEANYDDAILNNKKLVISQLEGRKEFELFLKLMLKVYENNLKKHLGFEYNTSQYQKFSYIDDNSINLLIQKLKVIEKTIQNLVYNPNLELILDRMVIEMRNLS